MVNNKEKKLPYSWHTFIYPFCYDEDNEEIKKIIQADIDTENRSVWKLEDEISLDGVQLDNNSHDEDLLRYAKYHYFVPAARDLLFNKTDNSQYRHFSHSCINDNKAHFKIKVGYEDNGARSGEGNYTLTVDNIRLSLYPQFCIGILAIELEYTGDYEADSKVERDIITQITEINELGRRVFAPTLVIDDIDVKKESKEFRALRSINAESISIDFPDGNNITKEFVGIEGIVSGSQELIEGILYKKPLDEIRKLEAPQRLRPALDDRMFVSCILRKNSYSAISRSNCDCNERYYSYQILGSQAARQLYSLIFLEARSSGCESDLMIQDKLKKHVYDRWINWGTVHGITEYSMVCLTGEDASLEKSVINPFLTIYVDMAKLALIQRAAIINMEHEASQISKEIRVGSGENNKNSENNNLSSLVKRSQNLWKKYIKFQNELYIPEVTFQEQGVEMYDMLKTSLRLKEQNQYLEDELNDFHALAEMEEDRYREKMEGLREESNEKREKLNLTINIMAIVSIILAVASMAQDYMIAMISTDKELDQQLFWVPRYFLGYIILLIVCIISVKSFSTALNGKTEQNRTQADKDRGKRITIILSVTWFVILIVMALIILGVNVVNIYNIYIQPILFHGR